MITKKGAVLVLMLLASGCATTQSIDSTCIWLTYPPITKRDAEELSPAMVLWVDNVGENYKKLCAKK